MRLIDANQAKLSLDWNLTRAAADVACRVIDACPTVNAVVVTRCKGCKHYANHPNGLCYLHTEPKVNARGYSGDVVCVEPDDFCSYGEPKEG